MENFDKTEGAQTKDWQDANDIESTSAPDSEMPKGTEKVSGWADFTKGIPDWLKALESNFAFTIMFVSIVGYVIIAAFGQMNTLGKYLGYLLFLTIMFCSYKLLKSRHFLYFFKKANRFFIVLVLVLAILIIYQNFNFIGTNINNGWQTVKGYLRMPK